MELACPEDVESLVPCGEVLRTASAPRVSMPITAIKRASISVFQEKLKLRLEIDLNFQSQNWSNFQEKKGLQKKEIGSTRPATCFTQASLAL